MTFLACAASFVRPIQNTSHLVTFGTIAATGNAVMRLEIDEVELVSGNWNVTGLTIPVCGEQLVTCFPVPQRACLLSAHAFYSHLL